MNKQGKDGIEWCDYTWNPVTGCLHGCPYCYAKAMYHRFNKSFEPMFNPKKLDEPGKVKKPSKIFVVSAGDLFGEWVPDEWIENVFSACKRADYHQYLFLTKNPYNYSKIYRSYNDYRCNMWFGATVTNQDDMQNKGYDLFCATGDDQKKRAKRFLSIEPLLGEINEITLRNVQFLDWVIIGQQTGAGAVPPKPEWVQSIIDQCKAAGVPVFVKSPLYEQFSIQEWPEGLKGEEL